MKSKFAETVATVAPILHEVDVLDECGNSFFLFPIIPMPLATSGIVDWYSESVKRQNSTGSYLTIRVENLITKKTIGLQEEAIMVGA